MAFAPRIVEPPFYDPPLVDNPSGQQHSQAWTEYHQSVSDLLTALRANSGVTDGSDAAAGQVGEYMTASGSVPLANNTVTTVATLNLTAGDWEVSGGVTFTISGAASTHYAAGIDGTFGSEIIATIPTGSGTWRLSAGAPVRRNVTAATAVHLSAFAGFTSGAVSAAGTLQARRVR
jgi:hypothetical protein